MTRRLTLNLAAAALSAATLAAPLAAETAAPMAGNEAGGSVIALEPAALSMAKVSTLDAAKMGQPGASLDLSSAPRNGVRNQNNILNWNNDFAMLDANEASPRLTRPASGKARSFTLDAIEPDFGEPETLNSEFALIDNVTFQPRAPVRQSVGAEFEQTYAYTASANADSPLDTQVSTIGRATNVKVRF